MVPINPEPEDLTSYVLGDLPPEKATDFEAVLRGDAELRSKTEDTAEVIDALNSGLRVGPGGLSENQRNAVLDHLDAVTSAASDPASDPVSMSEQASMTGSGSAMIQSAVTSTSAPVLAPEPSAYFSTKKAFKTASIAAGLIFVIGGSFILGTYNSNPVKPLGSTGSDSLKNELESDPMVSSVEESDYEMRVRLSLPDKVNSPELMLTFVDGAGDEEKERELASWEAYIADMADGAGLDEQTENSENLTEWGELTGLAVHVESSETKESDDDISDHEQDGFRMANHHRVSAVPVVTDSDFYETLWTEVRRESRLPARDIVAVEQLVNYFPYNYPEPEFGQPLSVSVETGECPWNKNHALVRVGIRGRDVLGGGSDEVVARDLGVVADFNAAIVKSYRLIGYSRCSQDAAIGEVVHDAETGADLHANQTVTALYEVIPLGLDEDNDNREISRRSDLKERGEHHPVGVFAGIFNREGDSNDLMSLRLIYRIPGTLQHVRKVKSVPPQMMLWKSMDDDFRFAAVVAGFGLRLKGDLASDALNYNRIEKLAKGALGNDYDGRRAEFLALVKQVKFLPDTESLKNDTRLPVLASPQR